MIIVSIQLKIKLTPNAKVPLPSVTRIQLDEQTYQSLEQWAHDMELYLREDISQLEIACQLNNVAMSATPDSIQAEYSLYILIHEWPADSSGTELTFSFIKKPKKVSIPEDRKYNPWKNTYGVFLDHQEENARVIISIEGALFTRYMYSPFVGKPYYYPLIGPNGKSLVQDAPDDHLHHHGLWWGHDDVNGHRVYHEFRREGRQVHNQFLAMVSGPVFGQITSLIDWNDEDGNLLLQETRSVRVYNLPPEARYTDLCTCLHAVNGDVQFGSTKEGGFPFIRVNEQINAHHTGLITSANGNTQEAGIFGTTAEWVDYSGKIVHMDYASKVPGKSYINAGIAVFAHPNNETFAAQWFVRDSGAFTPANFHFSGGRTLSSGATLSMEHRLYIHEGDVNSGLVQERYQEYVEPLKVEWIR